MKMSELEHHCTHGSSKKTAEFFIGAVGILADVSALIHVLNALDFVTCQDMDGMDDHDEKRVQWFEALLQLLELIKHAFSKAKFDVASVMSDEEWAAASEL